jgi:CBS domain containing-hemolysin-like protein
VITLLAFVAIGLVAALVLVTYVQHLYYESLRLRPRERASLEFFKSELQDRIGVDSDRGVLTFSVVKHTALLLLGMVFLLLNPEFRRAGGTLKPLVEAGVTAWLTMLAATYVAPHLLYRRSSGRWLAPLVPLLRLLALLARPLVTIFGFFQSLTELTENVEAAEEAPTPAENVEALITAGAEEGLIEESDRELIQSVVAFGDKTVREVMTPRPSMVAIGADQSLEDLRQLVINEQYSRIPVFEGSIDHVIGFVHVRDMFELDEEDRKHKTVRELIRPIRFVPETKAVNDLLREMQTDRAHMAIAIDEYGNTAGLATMEDLVEEVFGEIQDEHEPERDVTQEADGNYVVSGNFGLDRLEELMDFHPVGQPESTTVGGLLMEWLGRVPQPGESIEREGIKIEVLASNELRVEQVRVARMGQINHA